MPDPAHGVELRTERLVLRPFVLDDLPHFAAFVDDPAYRRHLGVDHPHAEMFVRHNVQADPTVERRWVISLDGDVVGSVFLGIDGATGTLACLLDPARWRQRIALEACRAVVAFAFDQLQIAAIEASARGTNVASVRAMERLGMRPRDGAGPGDVRYRMTRAQWKNAATAWGGSG